MKDQLNFKTITEPLYTIPDACMELGIKQHALRRAVNCDIVPYYLPFGNRKYVRLSEVIAAIETFQEQGGAK